MFLRFFDTSAIDQFAGTIADALRNDLPAALCEADSKAARRARETAQQRVDRHVQSFAVSIRLNVYQKAKLGLRLQEALERAGYPEAFSRRFAYDVVSQVARLAASRR